MDIIQVVKGDTGPQLKASVTNSNPDNALLEECLPAFNIHFYRQINASRRDLHEWLQECVASNHCAC